MIERMERSSEEMRALLERIQKGKEEARREMASAIKYIAELIVASGFYGPFREAAEAAPKFGDRRSHQMDG